jgi:hypothetical protein
MKRCTAPGSRTHRVNERGSSVERVAECWRPGAGEARHGANRESNQFRSWTTCASNSPQPPTPSSSSHHDPLRPEDFEGSRASHLQARVHDGCQPTALLGDGERCPIGGVAEQPRLHVREVGAESRPVYGRASGQPCPEGPALARPPEAVGATHHSEQSNAWSVSSSHACCGEYHNQPALSVSCPERHHAPELRSRELPASVKTRSGCWNTTRLHSRCDHPAATHASWVAPPALSTSPAREEPTTVYAGGSEARQ